jgi:Flp pilus assembly protein TadG
MRAASNRGAGNLARSRLSGGPVRIAQVREPAGRPAADRIARPTAGQALVEFAMSALIALLLILGAVEFSRIMLVYTTLAEAARLGARYAITHGTIPGSTGSTDPTAGVTAVVQKFLAPGTVNISSANITTSFPGNNATTTPPCPPGATTPGCPVQVTVSYPYNLLVSHLPINVTLSTTSEGIFTW